MRLRAGTTLRPIARDPLSSKIQWQRSYDPGTKIGEARFAIVLEGPQKARVEFDAGTIPLEAARSALEVIIGAINAEIGAAPGPTVASETVGTNDAEKRQALEDYRSKVTIIRELVLTVGTTAGGEEVKVWPIGHADERSLYSDLMTGGAIVLAASGRNPGELTGLVDFSAGTSSTTRRQ